MHIHLHSHVYIYIGLRWGAGAKKNNLIIIRDRWNGVEASLTPLRSGHAGISPTPRRAGCLVVAFTGCELRQTSKAPQQSLQ
mmetsp:Transcript_66638/g.56606  ORF Transcript_66638/g.56606 Transcript_66638/m.56606 type:complete len:82 (-) Transcript_66638:178-423(-)